MPQECPLNILELEKAYSYVKGRSLLVARCAPYPTPPYKTSEDYFWRGYFEVHGELAIYGNGPRSSGKAHCTNGPRARVKGCYATLSAFLDFLCLHAPDFPGDGVPSASVGHLGAALLELHPPETDDAYTCGVPIGSLRSQCSAGKLTFTIRETISLVRALYNDENLLTDRAMQAEADEIYEWRRVDKGLAGRPLQVA